MLFNIFQIDIRHKRNGITKFKLRTSRYLFTLKVDDKVKADKIMQSIPPNLKKVYPDSKK